MSDNPLSKITSLKILDPIMGIGKNKSPLLTFLLGTVAGVISCYTILKALALAQRQQKHNKKTKDLANESSSGNSTRRLRNRRRSSSGFASRYSSYADYVNRNVNDTNNEAGDSSEDSNRRTRRMGVVFENSENETSENTQLHNGNNYSSEGQEETNLPSQFTELSANPAQQESTTTAGTATNVETDTPQNSQEQGSGLEQDQQNDSEEEYQMILGALDTVFGRLNESTTNIRGSGSGSGGGGSSGSASLPDAHDETRRLRRSNAISMKSTNKSGGSGKGKDYGIEEDSTMLELLQTVAENKSRRHAVVHRGVTCDECNTCPLRGVRYKCAQCGDFDLCEVCESKNIHRHHIFIKIKIPTPPMMNSTVPLLDCFYPGELILQHLQPQRHDNDDENDDGNAVGSRGGGYKYEMDYLLNKNFKDYLKKIGQKQRSLKVQIKFSLHEIYSYYDMYCSLAGLRTIDNKYHNESNNTHSDESIMADGVDYNTFLICLGKFGNKNSYITQLLFRFYDDNDDGLISFDEMIIGLNLLTRSPLNDSLKVSRIFKLLDSRKNNFVSKSDIANLLVSVNLYHNFHVSEMMNNLEMGSIVNYSSILSDQPSSAAFTANISPDAPSVLDKELDVLRHDINLLRNSNPNQTSASNTTSTISILNSTAESSDDTHNPATTNIDNDTELDLLSSLINNPSLIPPPSTLPPVYLSSSKDSEDIPLLPTSTPELTNNPATQQVQNTETQQQQQQRSPDSQTSDEHLILDYMISDLVRSLVSSIFNSANPKYPEHGLDYQEFVNLLKVDPRIVLWFESMGPIF